MVNVLLRDAVVEELGPGKVVELAPGERDDTDATVGWRIEWVPEPGPACGVVCPIWSGPQSTKRRPGSLEGVCERRCLWTIDELQSSVTVDRGLIWSSSRASILTFKLGMASALGTLPGCSSSWKWTASLDAVDVSGFISVSGCVTMRVVESRGLLSISVPKCSRFRPFPSS